MVWMRQVSPHLYARSSNPPPRLRFPTLARQMAGPTKSEALATLKQVKYWPPARCVDNVYDDRNLFCSCVPVVDYA